MAEIIRAGARVKAVERFNALQDQPNKNEFQYGIVCTANMVMERLDAATINLVCDAFEEANERA